MIMKKVFHQIGNILKKINNNHIDQYTAQCAYFTILSFIPFMILILTLTKYIGIGQDDLFFVLNKILPSNILSDTVLGIVKEVYSKSLGTITVSILFILWSAGRGFLALCKGLDSAYEVEENKMFMHFRLKATICTIAFVALIIATLLLVVFGNSINGMLQEKFNIVSNVLNIILKSKHILAILILTFVFSLAYRFIPNHGYRFKDQLPGALLAAIACDIISLFYSIYVEIFTGFSVMYGSLTSIVLAMMWLYACMYCILIGAMINKKISKRNMEKSIKE